MDESEQIISIEIDARAADAAVAFGLNTETPITNGIKAYLYHARLTKIRSLTREES